MTPVLGIDPGFANIGYSVVLLGGDGETTPVSMGVFTTEKSSAKKNVTDSDDNVRRARDIWVFLRDLLTKGPHGPIRAMCAERMSFPRNSSVAAKIAMCWGVVAALSAEYDIPLLQTSPQDLKLKVVGNKTAKKPEVMKALELRFGAPLKKLCANVNGERLEHPYDALGTVVACLDSEVLRVLRRMSPRTG